MKKISIPIIVIAIVASVICFSVINWQNRQIEIEYIRSPENMICLFDGKYCYTRDDGVYCDDQQIIKTAGKPLVYTYNDTMYVYDNRSVIGYDKSFTKTESYDLPCEVMGFVVADKTILFIDESKAAYVMNKQSGDIIEGELQKNNIEIIETIHFDEFIVMIGKHDEDKHKSVMVFDNNYKQLFLIGDDESTYVPILSDERIITADRHYSEHTQICTFDLKNDEQLNTTIDTPSFYLEKDIYSSENKLIFIGTRRPSNGYNEKNVRVEQLKYHRGDCVCIINANNNEIESEFYFGKYEMVLYADTEKTVTYYKGKIYTKDTSSGDTLDSYKYDKFKPFGKYRTAVFDNHIFVFEKDGELIDVIEV